MKSIVFTVTTDLNFDQRMQRICTSLQEHGYDVLLVGRKTKTSPPLSTQPYQQKRLNCLFEKGKLFYFEYNIRLILFLLFKKTTIICAVDLDTLLGIFTLHHFKKFTLVHDAHEYFSELPEVVDRPTIKNFWKGLEKKYYPKIKYAYTVTDSIADHFNNRYGCQFKVIRNLPYKNIRDKDDEDGKYIIYSGALNKGRGLEELISALKGSEFKLHICGTGDLSSKLKALVASLNMQHQILFKGKLDPEALKKEINDAWLGYSLLKHEGMSYYYSLSNKFFDYINAELPQLAPNFPEYRFINQKWHVAELLEVKPELILNKINELYQNKNLYLTLKTNAQKAKEELNWELESKKLIEFYDQIES